MQFNFIYCKIKIATRYCELFLNWQAGVPFSESAAGDRPTFDHSIARYLSCAYGYGDIRHMGSNMEDTELRTDRCVTEPLSSRVNSSAHRQSIGDVVPFETENMRCDFRINRSEKNSLLLLALVLGGFCFQKQIWNVANKFCMIKPHPT